MHIGQIEISTVDGKFCSSELLTPDSGHSDDSGGYNNGCNYSLAFSAPSFTVQLPKLLFDPHPAAVSVMIGVLSTSTMHRDR